MDSLIQSGEKKPLIKIFNKETKVRLISNLFSIFVGKMQLSPLNVKEEKKW